MFEWASWESSNDLSSELYAAWEDLADLGHDYEIEKELCGYYRRNNEFLQSKIRKLEQTVTKLDGINSELRSQIDTLEWELRNK